MDNAALIACSIALAMVLLGGPASDAASRAILLRKQAEIRRHDDRMAGEWKARAARGEDLDLLRPSMHGMDGAVAIWRDSCRESARSSACTKEQAKEWIDCGVVSADDIDPSRLRSGADNEARCRRSLAPTGRLAAGIALAATCSSLSYAALTGMISVFAAAAGIACVAAGSVAAACDAKARILPYQLSYAILATAIAYQWALGGLAASLLLALIASAAGVGGRALMSTMGKPNAIGMGDVRTLPGVAAAGGPTGFALGMAACIVATIVIEGARRAARRTKRGDTFPFGAYLDLWLVVAVCAAAYCPNAPLWPA